MPTPLAPAAAARILDLGAPPPSRPRSGVAPRIALALVAISTLAAHGGAPRGFPRTAQAADESPAGAIGHIQTTDPMTMPRSTTLAATLGLLATTPSTLAQDAVQLRVEDGGNGHWYAGVVLAPQTSWSGARDAAAAVGGHLATFTTVAEFDWTVATVANDPALWYRTWGPFIGGLQDPGGSEPLGGWAWITGEPWLPIWGPSNCGADNFNGQDALGLGRCNGQSPIAYSDAGVNTPGFGPPGTSHAAAILEWSADCNADGLVDFGQIRAGELADANGNNIPDCCEGGPSCAPCPGDTDASGTVDGVDLAIILSRWGTPAKDYPAADTNGDGTVDGIDLATVLGGWGACP